MYFSTDYFSARTRFRQAVAAANGRLETLPLRATGPEGEPLGIDIGWFGAPRPGRILLHSSGLHGVEGFAGSAIQLRLLESAPQLPQDAALILVHILNPFGMAWLRRVNENNVDLNRNFVTGGEYSGAPEQYAQVDSFLNPRNQPRSDLFLLKAFMLILGYGLSTLKQAVASGQYEFPAGLFFGGKELQESPSIYTSFLENAFAGARRIVAIDVHTGLGNYGKDTLLVEPGDYARLRRLFGVRVTPSAPASGPAYTIRGGIHPAIKAAAHHAQADCVCQEFGTYNSVRVLRALRDENQWHHYGTGSLDHWSKQQLKEMFFPADVKWRQSILERGEELVRSAIDVLADRRANGFE